jgi:hypothetical protein
MEQVYNGWINNCEMIRKRFNVIRMNNTWDEGFSVSIQFESRRKKAIWNCWKLNCSNREFNAIKKASAKLNKVKGRKSSIAENKWIQNSKKTQHHHFSFDVVSGKLDKWKNHTHAAIRRKGLPLGDNVRITFNNSTGIRRLSGGKWTAKYSFPIPVDSVRLSCESYRLWKRAEKGAKCFLRWDFFLSGV